MQGLGAKNNRKNIAMKTYIVNPDGSTKEMKKILCADENRELQKLLFENLDLIPGDQIKPEDPCRWLLIKDEMPVPDPSTGAKHESPKSSLRYLRNGWYKKYTRRQWFSSYQL